MSRKNTGKTKNLVNTWVPKSFHTQAKINAARQGISMQEYLRNLELDGKPVQIKKEKPRWNFEI